jgi:two-component system, cell cycle sensor histidine kinase and response regulator CckA
MVMTDKPTYEKLEDRIIELSLAVSGNINSGDKAPGIQKQYVEFFDRSPIGIFRTASDGRALYANSAMARILGFKSPAEVLLHYRQVGKQLYVKEKRRDQFLQLLREKGSVENFEYEGRTWDGRIIWLSMNAHISERGKDGSFIIDGFATDMTGRKRVEEALVKSEAHLRTLLRTIPDLVWLKDPQGVYLACNSRFESFFGAKEMDIIGKTDYDFVDRELADFFRENDKRAMERGKPSKNEEDVVFSEDGHHETLETIKTPMYSSDGELIGVLGIGRDITERKRSEQEREVLMAAIEQAGEMITLTDLNGIIQYANSAFERMTGYRREEVIGRSPRLLDSHRPGEAFFQRSWESVSSGHPWLNRTVHKRKDGTLITVDACISPIRNSAGKIVSYVSVTRDVTERLRLEEQIQQSQKMESVGRLAGGVAHDYNNMLNVILGSAELAMQKLSPDDPTQSFLRTIFDAANRSAAITRQLLAFARKQTISPKVLDLNETIEGMLKMIRRLIGEHIDLMWIPKAMIWRVKMDPSQIDQMLVNLCVNARDAISEVGRIIIETEKVALDDAYCAGHAGAVPGEYVRLTVSDDGCGMERDVLDHIFEPFFTTKAAGLGSGLGLATIYGIVKQNNGFIKAESQAGKGTTIGVYLPRHEGHTDVAVSRSAEKPPRSRGETILVVEDEPMTLEVTLVMLESLGYEVIATASPNEAIDLIKQHDGKIDLLLTDVVMPQMNGRELFEQVKALLSGVKTLFMSGYTANVIAHQGVLEEGIDFIEKPFSMNDLAAKVRMVLDNPDVR